MRCGIMFTAAGAATLVAMAGTAGGASGSAPVADEAAALRGELAALREKCVREGIPMGVADEFGVYNLTPEGKKVDELERRIAELTGGKEDLFAAARKAGWGTVPLGPKATISTKKTFAKSAELGGRKESKPGIAILRAGVRAAVVVSGGETEKALAEEFAWHLSEMAGEPFTVTVTAPEGTPSVIFGDAAAARAFGVDFDSLPDETAVVKRSGDRLFVGGTGAGASHALTYVLESLGCRYLWPGRLGKHIPRRSEIVLPEIDLVHTPVLETRAIRASDKLSERHAATTGALGFRKEEFEERQRKAWCDRPGNRDFWHWHGINDGRGTPGQLKGPGKYKWGHYFKDYIERYYDAHPDWFALQPDGTRKQSEKERPCLCMTNEGLIQETIENLVRDFADNPGAIAISACLPDGGHATPCMCEKCRALDSPDAPPRRYRVYSPAADVFDYVSLTDRVLWFMNRLADGVAERLPGKKLTTYAYSCYTDPPCWVKPSENLVILSVAGDYVNAYPRVDGGDSRGYARDIMAAWSGFGNVMLWRPNCIRGFNCVIPQNCSRRIFEDLETFKANGVVGTDFDANDEQWAIKGLGFYMTAKGHLNIDRLDYDTLLDDYCAAFGPAAAIVKEYFLALEKTTAAAADKRCGIEGYIDFFDPAPFDAILSRAAAAAASDPIALRRVNFLRVGLEYAHYVKRDKRSADAGDPDLMERLREYRAFMHRMYRNTDAFIAVNPRCIGFYDKSLRPLVAEGRSHVAAATNQVSVSFARGQWNPDDFFPAKSSRWDYVGQFDQRDDAIVNKCPDLPGDEIYKRYHDKVYASIVHKALISVPCTVSSRMMFDHRMAPIIVLADDLGWNEKHKCAEFRHHYEICLYDKGVNVWHHFFENGAQTWHKAASLALPEREWFRPGVVYDVRVTVTRNRHGQKEMRGEVGDYLFTFVNDEIPDYFHAGIIACEGRNFFYDFRVDPG